MVAEKYHFTVVRENKWNDERLGRFEIHIPAHDGSDPAQKVDNFHSYIKLTLNGKEVVLKTVQHDDRIGEASVNPSIFKGHQLNTIVLEPTTKTAFLKYKSSQIKFWESGWPALLLGIIGLAIDGAFAIGKASNTLVVFHLSEYETGFWMGVALLLKSVALVLLFIKGVNDAK